MYKHRAIAHQGGGVVPVNKSSQPKSRPAQPSPAQPLSEKNSEEGHYLPDYKQLESPEDHHDLITSLKTELKRERTKRKREEEEAAAPSKKRVLEGTPPLPTASEAHHRLNKFGPVDDEEVEVDYEVSLSAGPTATSTHDTKDCRQPPQAPARSGAPQEEDSNPPEEEARQQSSATKAQTPGPQDIFQRQGGA